MSNITVPMIVISSLLCMTVSVRGQVAPPDIQMTPAEAEIEMSYPTLKNELGASDVEWALIRAKITNLRAIAVKRAAPHGNHVPPPPPLPPALRRQGVTTYNIAPFNYNGLQPPAAIALHDLGILLLEPSTPPDVINSKLTAYRAAQAKAEADFHLAQEDLRSILTLRQEAVCVSYGLLD